jgi:hypothetical protein
MNGSTFCTFILASRPSSFILRGTMAGRDGTGEKFVPGSRRYDRTVDEALKTMERLATWLETAKQDDIWRQTDDPLQVAMLHGMLFHLRQEIDQVLCLGGDELQETVRALRTLAVQGEQMLPKAEAS